MKQVGLFGQEYEYNPQKKEGNSKYIQFKKIHNYRKSDTWKCCKKCVYLINKEYHDYRYYKCMKLGESNSSVSDIRLSCVCNLFDFNPCWQK